MSPAMARLRHLFDLHKAASRVRSHVRHNRDGTITMVQEHQRTLSERDALKLKATELRQHVAAGGAAGAVAAAELERRAGRRKGRAPAERAPEVPETPAEPKARRGRRKAEAAPAPAEAVPAWPPPAQRFKKTGRYTKEEQSAIRRGLPNAPDVVKLKADVDAFVEEMKAKVREVGGDPSKVGSVLWPFGVRHGGASDYSRHDVFGVADFVQSKMRRHSTESAKRNPQTETVSGMKEWWAEEWTPAEKQIRASMDWWREHAHVFDPKTDLDEVMRALNDGSHYEKHFVIDSGAYRLLREVHGVDFLHDPDRPRGYALGRAAISDILSRDGRPPKMTLDKARQQYEEYNRVETERKTWGDAVYQEGAKLITQAFATLRESGRKAYHGPNLMKKLPGMNVTVQPLGRDSREFEVIVTGGILKDHWRFIGPKGESREEAWGNFEQYAAAIAEMPEGLDASMYQRDARLKATRKGRAARLLRRLFALLTS